MEHELEEGNLDQSGKSWADLQAWALNHYGEAWPRQQEAIQLDRQQGSRVKASKRRRLLAEAEGELDRQLLLHGKTWSEMMRWPPHPNTVTHDTIPEISSPVISERSSTPSSGYSTFPPSEEADIPEETRYGIPASQEPDDPWEQLEWSTVRGDRFETVYEMQRARLTDSIRSSREDKVAEKMWHERANQPENDVLDSPPNSTITPEDGHSVRQSSATKGQQSTLKKPDDKRKTVRRPSVRRAGTHKANSSSDHPPNKPPETQGKKRSRGRPPKISNSEVPIPLKKAEVSRKSTKRKDPEESEEKPPKRRQLDHSDRRQSRRVQGLSPEYGKV